MAQQGHYPFGENWYQSGTTTKWQFTSYERDGESGLDYAMFRYDSSRLGRFMTTDPIAGSIADPQSLNRYAYTRNDPINLVDALGLLIKCNLDIFQIDTWLVPGFEGGFVEVPVLGGRLFCFNAFDLQEFLRERVERIPREKTREKDVTLGILRTFDCNLNAAQLMEELQKNFSSLAGYSGPEGSISFEPEAIVPGAQIDISTDLWWTREQNISVVVSSANQTSFTFSAVEGAHFFYPAL